MRALTAVVRVVRAPARHPGAPQRAGGGGDEPEAVVHMPYDHVLGPAVVRALEREPVVAEVKQMLGLRGLDGLQGQALDARAGERSGQGGQARIPCGPHVQRERALEGHPAALDRGDTDRPLIGHVRGELGLVVPGVRLGSRAAARHVLQKRVVRVVREAQQDQPAAREPRGVGDRDRPVAARGGLDGRQGLPFIPLVAGPALEGPGLGLDRGDQGVPTLLRSKPDEAAGPGPAGLRAAVAAAVLADQLGQVLGGDELRTAAARAAQHDAAVADPDDAVDAVRAGRDDHRAAAGLSGSGEGSVDRGRGVRGAVVLRAVREDVGAHPRPWTRAAAPRVAGTADVGDLRVVVGIADELPPQLGHFGAGRGRGRRPADDHRCRRGCRAAQQSTSAGLGHEHRLLTFVNSIHVCVGGEHGTLSHGAEGCVQR